MCTITISEAGNDVPENHCSSCDMRFNLYWQRNAIYARPEYCPFCGEEIEAIINQLDNPK